MNERIAQIQRAVEKTAGGKALHVHSVPIRETFQGQIVWEGVVEAFALGKDGPAVHCFAWSFVDEAGQTQFVTVLEKPPVKSPQDAVKAYVASLGIT